MLSAYRVLARLRSLRGTPFDIFGMSAERKLERQLIRDYEATLAEIADRLDAGNHALAVDIASIPERIRGFGHVKARHLEAARAREAELLGRLPPPRPPRRRRRIAGPAAGGVIRNGSTCGSP